LGNYGTAYTDSPNTRRFQGIHGGRDWKANGDRLLNPCCLSRDDHNRKIRTRKQRTDVGKYSYGKGSIKSWNQLPANFLASFPYKLNTFIKRVKDVVTSQGFKWGLSVNK